MIARLHLTRLCVAAAILLGCLTLAPAPAAHAVGVSVCSALPGPLGAACSEVGSVASGVAHAATCAADPIACLSKAVGGVAAWAVGQVAKLVTTITAVNPMDPGFLDLYARIFGIALFLLFGRLLIAFGKLAVRGKARDAGPIVFAGLPGALLATVWFPALISFAIGIGGEITRIVTYGSTDDVKKFTSGLSTVLTTLTAPVGVVGGIATMGFLAAMILLAAGCLLIVLVVLAASVYASALFAPFVLTGLIHPDSHHSVRRYLHVVGTAIFAQPAIAAVLALGARLAAEGNPGDSFATLFIGVGMLWVAVFVTALIWKWLPSEMDAAIHAVSARRELSGSGPAAAVPGPSQLINRAVSQHAVPKGAGRTGGGAGASSGAGVAAGAGGAVLAGVGAVHAVASKVSGHAQAATPPAPGPSASNGGSSRPIVNPRSNGRNDKT